MTKANLRHYCAAFHPSTFTDLDLGVEFSLFGAHLPHLEPFYAINAIQILS